MANPHWVAIDPQSNLYDEGNRFIGDHRIYKVGGHGAIETIPGNEEFDKLTNMNPGTKSDHVPWPDLKMPGYCALDPRGDRLVVDLATSTGADRIFRMILGWQSVGLRPVRLQIAEWRSFQGFHGDPTAGVGPCTRLGARPRPDEGTAARHRGSLSSRYISDNPLASATGM